MADRPTVPPLGRLAHDFRAIGHSIRLSILGLLTIPDMAGHSRSSSQLARVLEPLGSVAYRVRILADAGLLEATDQVPRRGAVETFYRPTERGKQLARLATLGRKQLEDLSNG